MTIEEPIGYGPVLTAILLPGSLLLMRHPHL